MSDRMGQRATSKIRADDRPVCPTCGRDAVGTVTGRCIYCLNELPTGGSRIEAGKILRLSEFERVRGQVRRSRGARNARKAGSGLVGIAVVAGLLALLLFCMRWLEEFFSRGTSWRQ